MDKIKIAFLIDKIDYQFGGTETQLVMLLEKIDRTRFEPILCCLHDSPWLRDHLDLVRSYIVDFRSFFSFGSYRSFWKFVRFLASERGDILQTHFRDSNIVGAFAGKLARVPFLVGTRRNLGYWHNRIELAVLRLTNPLTDRFIVNAESIRAYTREKERIADDRMTVIYNGLVLDEYRQDPREARQAIRAEQGISSGDRVIVQVGNLRTVKGIDILIDAVADLLVRHSNAHLLIVGEGPERARLEAQIGRLGLNGRIRLLGRRKDIARVLQASDIGVLASHSEGLSNAIIEYMAAGLAVVATRVGGNPELIESGVSGYLVPSGDSRALGQALEQLINQPELAVRFGAAARAIAFNRFDVNQCVQMTQQFYERAVRTATDGSRRMDSGSMQ